MSAPRMSRCSLPMQRPAPTPLPWSARARSARSSLLANPWNAGNCSKRRRAISGLHARRKDAEQKLRAADAEPDVRLGEILSDQEQPRAAQLQAPGACCGTLSQADGPNPSSRGEAASCALDRSRTCRRGCNPGGAGGGSRSGTHSSGDCRGTSGAGSRQCRARREGAMH